MGFAPVSFNSYGWKGGQPYNNADIPIANEIPVGIDRTVLEQRFAYEWFDQSGRYALGRNPAFHTGAAGRLVPSLSDDGVSNRILRGFIRRSQYDVGDYRSGARLYFMYNPENITRDYVSYLDQGALDPFNSVFQSGNLVPPPSFMDFTFSLLFDRQEEARNAQHPGVFVDYEYFDLVVRNVDPSIDPNSPTSTALPDNGVMMVNPRDITVVFSPQITVQGRPSNARVVFQRFTHRMVPTRMQIDLTMRVTYFGPMKDMIEYPKEEQVATQMIPWNENPKSPFTMSTDQIEAGSADFLEQMAGGDMLTLDETIKRLLAGEGIGDISTGTVEHNEQNIEASAGVNASIVDFALRKINEHHPHYNADYPFRQQLWVTCDCSSFVWGCFADSDDQKPAYNKEMGWTFPFGDRRLRQGVPDTRLMLDLLNSGVSPAKVVFSTDQRSVANRKVAIEPHIPKLAKGDLLFRRREIVTDRHGELMGGHVAFVYSNDLASHMVQIVDAGSPTSGVRSRPISYNDIATGYTEAWRPMLGAPDLSGNR